MAALGLCCCARAFSSCGEQGLLFIEVHRLLIAVASLCCGAWALGVWASVAVACGLSSCGMRAQQLWLAGLVAPRHVGSSRTRAQTRVPCTGRQILKHCATGKVPQYAFEARSQEYLNVNQNNWKVRSAIILAINVCFIILWTLSLMNSLFKGFYVKHVTSSIFCFGISKESQRAWHPGVQVADLSFPICLSRLWSSFIVALSRGRIFLLLVHS